MNHAIIIAGGIGTRMNNEIPKQFIEVFDKPIIIYTLETFQNHSGIDRIIVVCVDGWHDILAKHCERYGISKLERIVNCGETRHESIYNGLSSLHGFAGDDDVVILADANRPLTSAAMITDSINVCKKHGAAMSAVPCYASMYISSDGQFATGHVPRETLYEGTTPESLTYGKMTELYQKANSLGINNLPATALLNEFGEKAALSRGSVDNIKITTKEDIEIFKALYAAKGDKLT